jgi:hypothetical protein
MKRTFVAGLASAVVLSGGLIGLGLGAGTAHAEDGPHRWCPGQSMEWPTGPWGQVDWDMTVCHTWWGVGYQQGNLPLNYGDHEPSDVWEGDNPPPPPPPQCNAPGTPPCWLFP